MIHRILKGLAFAGLLMVAAASSAAAQGFKVIAHESVIESELSKEVATRIFLKQTAKFPSGVAAKPADLAKGSSTRAAFTTEVLGRSVSAVETYWQQQIFAGREVPPAAKSSDDEMVAYVRSTPGAIGYVSAGAATAGVKVIAIR